MAETGSESAESWRTDENLAELEKVDIHRNPDVEKTLSAMEEVRVVAESNDAWESREVRYGDGIVALAALPRRAKGPVMGLLGPVSMLMFSGSEAKAV